MRNYIIFKLKSMSNKNKRRGILNQIIEEPEEKNEVVEKEAMVIDPEVFETKLFVEEKPEEKLMTEEEVVAQEEFVNEEPCVCEEPCTEPCTCSEEIVEVPKPERTIESLTRSELREFQRTGKMPQ
jgi:hypothetical protein